MPGVPREPPEAHPHYERPGEAEPGDKAAYAGCEDLPPTRQACLRLVSALAVEQSEEWVTGRRYLGMRELEQRH